MLLHYSKMFQYRRTSGLVDLAFLRFAVHAVAAVSSVDDAILGRDAEGDGGRGHQVFGENSIEGGSSFL